MRVGVLIHGRLTRPVVFLSRAGDLKFASIPGKNGSLGAVKGVCDVGRKVRSKQLGSAGCELYGYWSRKGGLEAIFCFGAKRFCDLGLRLWCAGWGVDGAG